MAEHKAPYETPDAVITMALRHHKRLDGGRIFLARNWLRKMLRRKPIPQTFVIWIIYRGWEQHTEIVTLNPGMIVEFADKLLAAPTIRQVHIAELWFKGRKSFGIDYDPAQFTAFINKVAAAESVAAIKEENHAE